MINRQFLSVLTDDLIVSVKQAETIGKKDNISSEDLAQYCTIINVWCAMAIEYSPWTGYNLYKAIERFGLKPVIREASKVSSRLLDAMQEGIDSEIDKLIAEGNIFGLILDEIRKTGPVTSMFGNAKDAEWHLEVSLEEIMLQFLRFPKRLTFVKVDSTKAIAEFRQWDNRNKMRDRVENSYNYMLRDILKEIVPWKRIIKSMKRVQGYVLPVGTTAEGYRTYGEKFNALLPFYGSIFGHFPPISGRIKVLASESFYVQEEREVNDWMWFAPVTVKRQVLITTQKGKQIPDMRFEKIPGFWSCAPSKRIHARRVNPKGTVARLAAVPKSLDESRIIAMECIKSQARAIAMLPIWYDYIDGLGIKLKEQEYQGRKAVLGSRREMQDDPFCPCTIDSHRASDSITKSQQRIIFPAEYLDVVEEVLPIAYKHKDEQFLLYGAATSGNALTFIHECLFFKSVGIGGCLLAYPLYFGKDATIKDVADDVTIVGDDLEVPAYAYETTLWLLERVGIRANASKSYGPGVPFRESCGYDAYDGKLISSCYWPRTPIPGLVTANGKIVFGNTIIKDFNPTQFGFEIDAKWSDSTTSLISLQRNLYRTFPKAATILGQILIQSNHSLVARPAPLCDTDIIGTSNTTPLIREIECQIWDYSGKTKTYHKETRTFVLNRVAKPSVEWVLPTTPKSSDYELLRYAHWLLHGPEYFDPVCELAGCSRPSTFSLEMMFGTPCIKWKRSYE